MYSFSDGVGISFDKFIYKHIVITIKVYSKQSMHGIKQLFRLTFDGLIMIADKVVTDYKEYRINMKAMSKWMPYANEIKA